MKDTSQTELQERILHLLQQAIPHVVVTVIETGGSTPAHAGAKMVVTMNDTLGTVGGGELEAEAIERGRKLLEEGGNIFFRKYSLVKDLGSECGGWATLLYEPYLPWRVHVYGGGHVAAALSRALDALNFHVTVYDEREDAPIRSRKNDLSSLDIIEKAPHQAAEDTPLGIRDIHLVMTPTHSTDIETTLNLLRRGRPAFIGVLGSRRKALQLQKRLESEGMESLFEHIRIPVGIPIDSDTPQEIAVSIAAELIAFTKGREVCK